MPAELPEQVPIIARKQGSSIMTTNERLPPIYYELWTKNQATRQVRLQYKQAFNKNKKSQDQQCAVCQPPGLLHKLSSIESLGSPQKNGVAMLMTSPEKVLRISQNSVH